MFTAGRAIDARYDDMWGDGRISVQPMCRYSIALFSPFTRNDYEAGKSEDYRTDLDYVDSQPLVLGKWYTLVLEHRRSTGTTRARTLRGKPSDVPGRTMPQFLCTGPPVYDRTINGVLGSVDVAFGASPDSYEESWTQFTDLYITKETDGFAW